MLLHAVPAPSVNISGAPTFLYSGTSLSLTCTFELSSMIDSQVILNSVWRRGGEILNSNSRINISAIRMANPSLHRTILSISPVSNTMDSGQYSCQSAIVSSAYVLYTDASQQVTVRIEGINTLH